MILSIQITRFPKGKMKHPDRCFSISTNAEWCQKWLPNKTTHFLRSGCQKTRENTVVDGSCMALARLANHTHRSRITSHALTTYLMRLPSDVNKGFKCPISTKHQRRRRPTKQLLPTQMKDYIRVSH